MAWIFSGVQGQGIMGRSVMAASARGPVSETVTVTTEMYPIQALTSYVAFFTLVASSFNATARMATISINWYEENGTLISSSAGTPVSMAPGATEQVSVIATSPSNAANATVEGSIATYSTEVFSMAQAELVPGISIPAWSIGGVIGNDTVEIQYSYDGGVTWNDIRNGSDVTPISQMCTIIDYESPFNVVCSYRARTTIPYPGGSLSSSWSNIGTVTISSTHWWIIDPLTPTNAVMLYRVQITGGTVPPNQNSSITIDAVERQGVFRGLGESVAYVVRGDLWADEFDIGLYFVNTAAWETFNSIRADQTTLLLKSDMEGALYYVILGSDRPAAIMSASDRHYEPQRGLTIHTTPVAKP